MPVPGGIVKASVASLRRNAWGGEAAAGGRSILAHVGGREEPLLH